MPNWTEADYRAINEAIALGASRVKFADSRETVFRSLAEMRSIRDEIAAALGLADATPRVTYAAFTRD